MIQFGFVTAMIVLPWLSGPVWAGPATRVVSEAFAGAGRLLGREAADEGASVLTRRAEVLAGREAATATRAGRQAEANVVERATQPVPRPSASTSRTEHHTAKTGHEAILTPHVRVRPGRVKAQPCLPGGLSRQALDFAWRNKGPLAIVAVLAAFVRDPAPFLHAAGSTAGAAARAAFGSLAATVPGIIDSWPRWPVVCGAGLLLTFVVCRAARRR